MPIPKPSQDWTTQVEAKHEASRSYENIKGYANFLNQEQLRKRSKARGLEAMLAERKEWRTKAK